MVTRALFVVCFATMAGQSHAQVVKNYSQPPRSILDRDSQGRSVMGDASQPHPAATRRHIAVDSRASALETRLRQEQQLLERHLAQFARMREAALKGMDEKALLQISGLERKAVDNYQRRVKQILNGNAQANDRSHRQVPQKTSGERSSTGNQPSRRGGLFGLGSLFGR